MSMLFISFSTKDRPTAEIFYHKLIEIEVVFRATFRRLSRSGKRPDSQTPIFGTGFQHPGYAFWPRLI